MNTITENQMNSAGDIIENQNKLLEDFKVSILKITWYKAWVNEAELIDFLNRYRKQNNNIISKAVNNKNYKQKNINSA